tara:strand:+ start:1195 stop:1332 length:138 start_codon:yes stop_codon:yes gene_type:complete
MQRRHLYVALARTGRPDAQRITRKRLRLAAFAVCAALVTLILSRR